MHRRRVSSDAIVFGSRPDDPRVVDNDEIDGSEDLDFPSQQLEHSRSGAGHSEVNSGIHWSFSKRG